MEYKNSSIKDILSKRLGTDEEDWFSTQDSYKFVDKPAQYSIDVNKVLDTTDFKQIADTWIEHDYITHIFLDSSNRRELTDKIYTYTNTMTWELNASTPVYRLGTINIKDNACLIVGCEIGMVSIADRRNYNGTSSMFPLLGDSLYNQRISILIKELGMQSYISQEGTKYHFMLKRKPLILDSVYQTATNLQRSYPTFIPMNKGLYKFNKPISRIDSITIQINCPFQPIVLDQEQYTPNITVSGGQITLLFNSDPSIYFNEITIRGFTTSAPITDKVAIDSVNQTYISNQINPAAVHVYTRISPTQIRLNVSSIGLSLISVSYTHLTLPTSP
jgi:hypothetical protein